MALLQKVGAQLRARHVVHRMRGDCFKRTQSGEVVLSLKPQAQQCVRIGKQVNCAKRTLVSRLHGLGVKRFHAWMWFVR